MKNQIYQLVNRQKKELLQPLEPSTIDRDGMDHLAKVLNSQLVKVILGPRRCGKSTLAKLMLQTKACAYINCEDEGFPAGASGDDIMSALGMTYPDA